MNRCYICKAPARGRAMSKDHILPQVLPKWTSMPKRMINNPVNHAVCCRRCNELKGSEILSLEQYLRYDLPDPVAFSAFYQECLPYIAELKTLIGDLSEKQDHKCSWCNKPLIKGRETVRRLDWNCPRSPENGCLICSLPCNVARSQKRKIPKSKRVNIAD